MHYYITHTTRYTYSQPIHLTPHTIRLHPRTDGAQKLIGFNLNCQPQPCGHADILDLSGNVHHRLWFQQPTDSLEITVTSQVETYRDNPFNFLLEPWVTRLPLEYPHSLQLHLQPYLQGSLPGPQLDPVAVQLAQDIWQSTDGHPIAFLTTLTQQIQQECTYTHREQGVPLPPGLTWRHRQGSCRDLTVLLMEACRGVNLATRFVSGYQEGDVDQTERHLHAWAEVYLPGAGWRGYDPTLGLAVSDRHIALSASAIPELTAPITGSFRGDGQQIEFTYHLTLQQSADTQLAQLAVEPGKNRLL